MTKQDFRKKYMGLREGVSHTEINKLSQKITGQFFSTIDFAKINVIHTFVPIISKKEVDTWPLIDALRTRYPQVRISIPKVEGVELINFYFESRSQLIETQWKILEPASGKQTPTEEIDLVIVPLLAFDKKGNRVGYGKGFYDKFLTECRSDCMKVGFSFFGPSNEVIPADAHDKKLDLVITPTEVYRFR